MYRSRDRIEKSFKIMMDYLEGLPIRIHDRHGLSGYISLLFFSLILELNMMKEMRKIRLAKKYSIKDLFIELSKIMIVELTSEKKIITEISKKWEKL